MKEIPDRLGRYRILRPLARGGMAELFLARASGIQGFEKLVVVKRVLPELARESDSDYVDMFIDEARLAARMHHSNLVQVYDIGEAEGLPFYAMEYLDGHDVRAMVRAAHARKEHLPIEHVLSIAIGVAAGLHYAHELRDEEGRPLAIVHRDVSPQNVAVTFDGGVKLFDFGVAKAKRRSTETRHGTLKGKIQYMSPEQCRGEEVDRRSDVFSVAILLWELTTGRRLYGGRSDFGVMKSIAEADAPRPSLVWPECPPELEQIMMRGLRRERQARFATTEELQLALEAFARERRLAVSGVGLAKHLRSLFAEQPSVAAEREHSTLYEMGGVEVEDKVSGATVVDGVFSVPIPLVAPSPADKPVAAAAAPERQTRAVGRALPRRRRLLAPLAAALGAALAVVAGVGGAVAWRLRAHAPTVATANSRATAHSPATVKSTVTANSIVTANSPATVASPVTANSTATTNSPATAATAPMANAATQAEPEPTEIEPETVTLQDHIPGGKHERGKSTHASKRGHSSRPHAHAHAPAPRATRPAVDLDAPLPPQ
jgi:serine/threonine protein kinase